MVDKKACLEVMMSKFELEPQFYHYDEEKEYVMCKFTYWQKKPLKWLDDYVIIRVDNYGYFKITYYGGLSDKALFQWGKLWLDDPIHDICTDFYAIANRQYLHIIKEDGQNVYCGLYRELDRLQRIAKTYQSREFKYSLENVNEEDALLREKENEQE